MDKLFIVMPAYNEEENIENVISSWYPILDGKDEASRIVVADGGSKDNTLNILNSLKEKYPKLEVFSKPGTDHGTKLIFLYDYAIKQNADFIFQTDSDGQTDPREFNNFWKMRNDYAAIFGNRSDREDGKSRVLVENVLRFVLFVIFGVTVPDANAPFRLMSSSMVNKYIYKLPSDFNLPNALICAYCAKHKENVSYQYVTFKPRQGGKNYINIKRIIKIGMKAVVDFSKLRRNM